MNIYERGLNTGVAHPGLRKLRKLREEHIRLSPCHRIRVKLAAQVSVCVIQVVLSGGHLIALTLQITAPTKYSSLLFFKISLK